MQMRLSIATAALLFMAMGLGCASQPYLANYRYVPSPALVEVFEKGAQPPRPAASATALIVGVRRGGINNAPPAVEIRMRFENTGHGHLTFDSESLRLVAGTLQTFSRPEIHGPHPLQLAPGESQTISAFFPLTSQFGPNLMGVDTLRLTWQIQIDGQPVPQTAYFDRASPTYSDPDN